MITVVTWLWGDKYTADHVNKTASMLKRHLRLSHRVVCITDWDKSGQAKLDSTIAVFPFPTFTPITLGQRYCRRLWIFSRDAMALGDQLFQLDIDMVILKDITDLIERHMDKTIAVWEARSIGAMGFALNPSFMWLKAGAHAEVWEGYIAAPERTLALAHAARCSASDQAVITYHFTRAGNNNPNHQSRSPYIPVWKYEDGILGLGVDLVQGKVTPPEHARVVSFHGRHDPSHFTHFDWVQEHWK